MDPEALTEAIRTALWQEGVEEKRDGPGAENSERCVDAEGASGQRQGEKERVLVDGRHSQGDIARRTANAARRALLRARRLRGQPDTAEALRRAHVEAKSALKMVIKKAKKAAWDELFPSLRPTAGESDAGRATANEVSDWMLEDSVTVREVKDAVA